MPAATDALPVTLADVLAARARIRGIAIETPLKPSPSLSTLAGGPVWLKVETMQATGAFKLRGAASRLLALGADERARGVVTVSTGNHGRGVAYVARQLGMRAVVCVSALVPQNKRAALRAVGAEVEVVGSSQDAAQAHAEALARDAGLILVSPFDDPWVIAGQGTCGLEIVERLPEVRSVLVQLSGGGLASGVALALKSADPSIRVIGVSSDRGPAMLRSLEAGRPIEVTEEASLADSLGGGIGLDNRCTFRMVQALVDDVRLVSDAQVAHAMRHAYVHERLVVEGAGAAGIAALLAEPRGIPTPAVLLLTGDNVDHATFQHAVCGADCGAATRFAALAARPVDARP
jgi:threonine dehydratase